MTNCVSLFHPVQPFIAHQSVEAPGRQLTVISDISNGNHSPNNPLPIYRNAANTDKNPTVVIPTPKGTPPLAIVMIPYLPSLLPKEAGESAANGLYTPFSVLKDWKNHRVWQEVEEMYYKKVAAITPTKYTIS